jgi:hypothetical protein
MRAARALVLVMVVGLAAQGCVRLDPPSSYACVSSSECPDGERCSARECLAPGECRAEADCSSTQHCSQGLCVADECQDGLDDSCDGYKCVAGICNKGPCESSFDCRAGYECDFRSHQCKPPLKYSGQSCTASSECLAARCCGTPGDLKCGLCLPNGISCSIPSDCQGGFCCRGSGGQGYCSSSCP